MKAKKQKKPYASRRTWSIKPVQRLKPSGRIYRRPKNGEAKD